MGEAKVHSWSHRAYGLPSGSIRAVLAFMVFGCIWYLLAAAPDRELPSDLSGLMFIIMGHYFAARSSGVAGVRELIAPKSEEHLPAAYEVEPAPLYLPRGTIRTLFILGFASIAGFLTYRHQWMDSNGSLNHAAISLILIAGFLLGVLRHTIFPREHRVTEDIRATVSLLAGVLLILMVLACLKWPEHPWVKMHLLKSRYQEIVAAVIGFYFGSKS